jgi:hypothetical protein
MLQDYANFSKAGNTVGCKAIEKVLKERGKVVVKDADGSFKLADRPSRYARIRQAASNFKTRAGEWVKKQIDKLRSKKNSKPKENTEAPKPEAQEPQGTVVNDGTGVPTKVRTLFDEYKALKKQGLADSDPKVQDVLKGLRHRGYAVHSNQLVEIDASNLSLAQRAMKTRAQLADRARQAFSRSPKAEAPKTDFEADTGIKPAGDRTVEELLPEWEAHAKARGYRLEHFEWNEGKTVTYEFLPKDYHVGRISGERTIIVENGKVVSDRVPFENSKGGYDYKTYDARGGMTKYEMTFEHNGNDVTITVDSDGVRYLDQPKNVIGGYGEATTWDAMYQKYGVELPYNFHDGSIIPVV